MATYTVIFTSENHPTNMDAVNVGLRVVKDDEYFQFFLVVVSGIELAAAKADTSDEWYAALAAVGVNAIQEEIRGGLQPNDNPSDARVLPISAASVAAVLDGERVVPQLTDGLVAGHEVATFEL
jgi:hypothetical protein